MSWQRLMEAFLTALRPLRSPRTIVLMRSHLGRFLAFCRQHRIAEPGQFQASALALYQQWLQWRPGRRGRLLSPHTVARSLTCVRQWFRWAVQEGHLLVDPTRQLVLKKPPRTLHRIPTPAEVDRLLAAPDPLLPWEFRDRVILELAYGTGMRREELHRLDLADLDLVRGEVRLRRSKGGKARVLPLAQRLVELLDQYVRVVRPELRPRLGESALWVSGAHLWGRPEHGTRLSYGTMSKLTRRYAKRAGLQPFGLHVLRHAFASHLLERGADLRAVQELLGHDCLGSTQIYTQLRPVALHQEHRRTHPRARPRRTR